MVITWRKKINQSFRMDDDGLTRRSSDLIFFSYRPGKRLHNNYQKNWSCRGRETSCSFNKVLLLT